MILLPSSSKVLSTRAVLGSQCAWGEAVSPCLQQSHPTHVRHPATPPCSWNLSIKGQSESWERQRGQKACGFFHAAVPRHAKLASPSGSLPPPLHSVSLSEKNLSSKWFFFVSSKNRSPAIASYNIGRQALCFTETQPIFVRHRLSNMQGSLDHPLRTLHRCIKSTENKTHGKNLRTSGMESNTFVQADFISVHFIPALTITMTRKLPLRGYYQTEKHVNAIMRFSS